MLNTAQTASGDALVLQCKDTHNFPLHLPGIWQAVNVDVIDLGLIWTEFQGQRKLVRKLKLVFETEHVGEDGKRGIVTKNFTASLHPKAKLAAFIGQWRGRPVAPGENVDLKKLPGACCTLVLSHQQSLSGRTYVSIDAVSKATKKVTPSGTYDPAAMRQRIAEWAAKDAAMATPAGQYPPVAAAPAAPTPQPAPVPAKSVAAPAAPDFDPEVGF
jgi:hypothetical protein